MRKFEIEMKKYSSFVFIFDNYFLFYFFVCFVLNWQLFCFFILLIVCKLHLFHITSYINISYTLIQYTVLLSNNNVGILRTFSYNINCNISALFLGPSNIISSWICNINLSFFHKGSIQFWSKIYRAQIVATSIKSILQ